LIAKTNKEEAIVLSHLKTVVGDTAEFATSLVALNIEKIAEK